MTDYLPSYKGSFTGIGTIEPIASVFDLMKITTGGPQTIFLETWDGTSATSGAQGIFEKIADVAESGATTDGGVDFVTDGGVHYRRLGVIKLDPAWYGAVGDGSSHQVKSRFSTLTDLQKFFPFAYSLNQEADFIGLQAVFNDERGAGAPSRTYKLYNSDVAYDDMPLTLVSGPTKGDFCTSTFDCTDLRPVTTVIEHCTDSTFTDTTGAAWENAPMYGPAAVTDVKFPGNGTATYTDPDTNVYFLGAITTDGVLTVSNFSGKPELVVGDTIYDTYGKVPTGTTITKFLTGTGDNGTYQLSTTGYTVLESDGDHMSNGTGHWGQWGQKVTLDKGIYQFTVEMTATRSDSYNLGYGQPGNWGIYISGSAPGSGNSPWSSGSNQHQFGSLDPTTETASSLSFVFEVTDTSTAYPTVWLNGYMNVKFTKFSITNFNRNVAVLATRDGSPEHYPAQVVVSGVTIIGPGRQYTGLKGIWYNSFIDTDGSVMNWANSGAKYFDVGMCLQNGAYLADFTGCGFTDNNICVSFPSGSVNAGENFKFVTGGLANAGTMLDNPGGAEFTFFSTTFDYSTQAITNNSGRIELFGVHAEMGGPSAEGKAMFHCINGGHIIMHGGMFLGAGDASQYKWPVVHLEHNTACMEFVGTEIYNLTCGDGRALVGPGQLKMNAIFNTGNANIGTFNNAVSDPLGLCGQFLPQGTSLLCRDGIGLIGGLYSDWYDSVAVIDQWTSARCAVTRSTDYKYGNNPASLKVVKQQGNNSNDRIIICVPIKKFESGTIKVRLLFPFDMDTGAVSTSNGVATTGTGAGVYVRCFYTSVIGSDASGRARYGGRDTFCGERDIWLTTAGNTQWMESSMLPSYLGSPAALDERDIGASGAGSPAYATHIAIVIDTESLPACTFYIGDIQANVF